MEHIRDEVKNVDNEEPSTAQTPPALVSSKTVDIKKQNEPYIKEVVDASRSILELALKGLLPNGNLKHAPVRTHFRILAGAMFLLKASAAMNASEPEDVLTVSRLLLLVEKKTKSTNHSSYLRTSRKR